MNIIKYISDLTSSWSDPLDHLFNYNFVKSECGVGGVTTTSASLISNLDGLGSQPHIIQTNTPNSWLRPVELFRSFIVNRELVYSPLRLTRSVVLKTGLVLVLSAGCCYAIDRVVAKGQYSKFIFTAIQQRFGYRKRQAVQLSFQHMTANHEFLPVRYQQYEHGNYLTTTDALGNRVPSTSVVHMRHTSMDAAVCAQLYCYLEPIAHSRDRTTKLYKELLSYANNWCRVKKMDEGVCSTIIGSTVTLIFTTLSTAEKIHLESLAAPNFTDASRAFSGGQRLLGNLWFTIKRLFYRRPDEIDLNLVRYYETDMRVDN